MQPTGTLMEKQQQQGRGTRLMRATCRPRHQLQLKRCSPCERSFALPSLYRTMRAPLHVVHEECHVKQKPLWCMKNAM